MKKFKLNQPGTKTFSELREIIVEELKSQLGIKNFKIQIRRTGGSKNRLCIFRLFLNDKKIVFVNSKLHLKETNQTTSGTWMISPVEINFCVHVSML